MAAAAAAAAAAASTYEILTEWEAVLKDYNEGTSRKNAVSLLPTALQLYKLGCSMHSLSSSSIRSTQHLQLYANVQRTYHAYLLTLPAAYRKELFSDLVLAVTSVLQFRADSSDSSDVLAALQSVAQLYDGSVIAAEDSPEDWSNIERLSVLLECYETDKTGPYILTICLHYLLQARDFENLLPALQLLQQHDGIWENLVDRLDAHDKHWKEKVLQNFPDESQQDYLMSLLTSEGHTEELVLAEQLKQATRAVGARKAASTAAPPATKISPEHEIQRRIDQVRAVLPHLGEGFIETALSCWKGSVQETLAKLLEPESHWPAPLQVMDRSLPRRHDKNALTAEMEAEAKAVAKAALQAATRQAEAEARMVDLVLRENPKPKHDEYDDDYDDQYDDMEGVGNADAGLYDDYEAVLTYNRVVKEVGAEQRFWEDNRNTNRPSNSSNTKVVAMKASDDAEAANEKAYRGPDKMRGGRIPGRGDGRGRGGRGSGSNTSGDPKVAAASDEAAGKKPVSGAGKKDGAKPNLRQKARTLDNRRDQQKKAQIKRTGV